MARKVTAPFTLTESIQISASDTLVTGTIDIGSYISVGERLALQVLACDFIYQGKDGNDLVQGVATVFDTTLAAGNDVPIQVQVTDLNRNEIVFADDLALVASGALRVTSAGNFQDADVYPDNYRGPEGRTIVNDTMYVQGYINATFDEGQTVYVSARLTCQLVRLEEADWIAIAIQSTGAQA